MKIHYRDNQLIKRLVSSGMALATVFTMIGCSPKENIVAEFTTTPTVLTDTNKNFNETSSKVKTSEEPIIQLVTQEPEVSSLESLLDRLDDKPVTINDTTEYMLEHIDKVLTPSGEITEEEEYIAAYAYQKLLSSNIDKDTFMKELHNMMVEQTLPRCASFEEYHANFGNILTTLGETESLYDTYYSLAWLTHDAECEEDHYINPYGSLECKTLLKEFNEKHK